MQKCHHGVHGKTCLVLIIQKILRPHSLKPVLATHPHSHPAASLSLPPTLSIPGQEPHTAFACRGDEKWPGVLSHPGTEALTHPLCLESPFCSQTWSHLFWAHCLWPLVSESPGGSIYHMWPSKTPQELHVPCSSGEESGVVCKETMLPAKEEGQGRVGEMPQGAVCPDCLLPFYPQQPRSLLTHCRTCRMTISLHTHQHVESRG